ncbi:MAG: NusG domain II-containing protein [Christensenellales bacterium]|jgi:hypothetical protein
MRKGDIWIFVLVAVIVVAALMIFPARLDGEIAVIRSDGVVIDTVVLKPDTKYDKNIILPSGGYNKVMIRGTSVRVVEADCPDKHCLYAEGNIVCLPHRLIITIETSEYDAESF